MSYWKDPSIAEAYKESEKITGSHAKQMIRQSGILQASSPLVVLDNACGTGVVSYQLYEMLDDSLRDRLDLTCADVSESMVEAVGQRIEACGWKGANAKVIDAQKLDLPSDYYTHVYTSFALMIFPDPNTALKECFRVLKPGGTCSFTTWHKLGWLAEIRGAFNHIPNAPPLPTKDEDIMLLLTRNPWHDPSYVADQLTSHGFKDVKVEICCNSTPVKNPEEFVNTFIGMLTKIVMESLWKGEEGEKEEFKSQLGPGTLAYLKEKYGEEPFGLQMDSLVVTARRD